MGELGDRAGIPLVLEFHVSLASHQAQWKRALQIGGAVSALRRVYGCPVTVGAQTRLDRALARAQEALGEQASTAAWNEGQSMTLDQAVALAASEDKD